MTSGAERLEYGTQVTSDEPVGHDYPDQGSVDPDFEGLFRPDDVVGRPVGAPPAPPAPASTPEPTADSVASHEAAPAPTSPGSDTGRLFRSQGVKDHADAVLALESGRFTRLRTLERTTDETEIAPLPTDESVTQQAADLQVAALLGTEAALAPEGDPMASSGRRARRQRPSRSTSRSPVGRGISAGAVSIVVIGVTVVVGLANALLGGGALGWPTGLALLASSVYAALTVRRDADTFAFLMPPIAFLVAALTAGQFFVDSNEGSLINRAAIVFFTLAENWVWIIGSTLVALVIVLVRRRRD